MAFFSSLCYLLPNVLNLKGNVQSNIERVKNFESIQLDIISLTDCYERTNKIGRDSIEHVVNDRIKSAYGFSIEIDPSKVNLKPLELMQSVLK